MASKLDTRDRDDLLEDFKLLIGEVSHRVLKDSVDPTLLATVASLQSTAADLTRALGDKGKEAADSIKGQIARLQSDEAEFRDALQKVLRESNAVTLGQELHRHAETLGGLVLKYEVVVLDMARVVQAINQGVSSICAANDRMVEISSETAGKIDRLCARVEGLEEKVSTQSDSHSHAIQAVSETVGRLQEAHAKWGESVESRVFDLGERLNNRMSHEFEDLGRWVTIGFPLGGVLLLILLMISCGR